MTILHSLHFQTMSSSEKVTEVCTMEQAKMEEGNSPGIVDLPKMIFQNNCDDDDTMSVSTRLTNVSGAHSSDDGLAIGAEETRNVTISRIVMFSVFVAAACGFGALTWFYTTGQEQEQFESTVSLRMNQRNWYLK